MLKNTDVIFRKGEILNSKMLEEIKEFPQNLLEIEYSQNSDGIIKGLEFFYDEDKNLLIQSGIIKYKKKFYLSQTPIIVLDKKDLCEKEGEDIYIYLKEKNEEVKENVLVREMKLNIGYEKDWNGVFLGKFIMRKNILPKLEYEKFEDFENDSFMNIVERKYSNIEIPTISPLIISVMASKLISLNQASPIENYIITKGLDKKTVNFNILRQYLEISKDDSKDETDNNYILLKIKEKLKKIKGDIILKKENYIGIENNKSIEDEDPNAH